MMIVHLEAASVPPGGLSGALSLLGALAAGFSRSGVFARIIAGCLNLWKAETTSQPTTAAIRIP